MKLIAYLIMTVCLVLGTLAATVAYSPRLDMPDEMLLTEPPLTLNADSGLASFGDSTGLVSVAQTRPWITVNIIETTLESPTSVASAWNSAKLDDADRSLSFARASGLLGQLDADVWDTHGASPEGYSHFLVAKGLLNREIEPLQRAYERDRFLIRTMADEPIIEAFDVWLNAMKSSSAAGSADGSIIRPDIPGFEQDEHFHKYWREWGKELVDIRKAQREEEIVDVLKHNPVAARALRDILSTTSSETELDTFVDSIDTASPAHPLRGTVARALTMENLRRWTKDAIREIEKSEAEEQDTESEDEDNPDKIDPRPASLPPQYPPAIAWLDDGVVIGLVTNGYGAMFEPVLTDATLAQSFLSAVALPNAGVGKLAPASMFTENQIEELDVEGDALLTGSLDHLSPVSLMPANVRLTQTQLATLRAAGVERARVKEFSFARWDVAWLMGVSCLGLGIAAFMVKMATKKEIAAELAQPSTREDSPGKSLERVVKIVAELTDAVNASSNDVARNEMVIDRIGKLQKNELATLADSRTTLVAVLSLSGYAKFMDRFSYMERLLNRAWSAAADGVTAEAVLCLNEAQESMPGVVAAMKPNG